MDYSKFNENIEGESPTYGAPHPQPQQPQGYVNPPGFPPSSTPGAPHPQQPQGYVNPLGFPIVQQPGHAQGPPLSTPGWMSIPQISGDCPPGLEYLTTIDQLLIHQEVDTLEVFLGLNFRNTFSIKNIIGQKVYYAAEEFEWCQMSCCGTKPFEMKVLDNFGNQIMNISRPMACDSCCFPCCLSTLEISTPPGNVIGSIEHRWSIFKPRFVVKDAAGNEVFQIKGPICKYAICGDVDFHILSMDGKTKIGKISKQWSGLFREMFTNADFFGITFPLDLDVKIKAVLLAGTFLLDSMYFDSKPEFKKRKIISQF